MPYAIVYSALMLGTSISNVAMFVASAPYVSPHSMSANDIVGLATINDVIRAKSDRNVSGQTHGDLQSSEEKTGLPHDGVKSSAGLCSVVDTSLSCSLIRNKDAISAMASITAMLFGLTGFTLGLLGYLRSVRTDRRVFHEPYFKKKWPDIYSEVSTHVKAVKDALDHLEHDERLDKDDGSLPAYHLKRLRSDFNIDAYDWSYDKRLKRKVGMHFRLTQDLLKLVWKHSALVFPSTSSFNVWVASVNLLNNWGPHNGFEPPLDQENTRRRIAEAKDVFEKYTPGSMTPLVLAQSKRFRYDKRILELKIDFKIKKIKMQMRELQHVVDFCNSRFTEE